MVYSVFPRHSFSLKSARVISLFEVQLSGFIFLSHVEIAKFNIVFWGFRIIIIIIFLLSFRIQITECFK